MKASLLNKKRLFGLQCLIIALLLLGIFFRFVNLDRKLFWYDETVTAVRNAGYTRSEIVEQLFDGREIGVEDLQKYLHTNSQKGLLDTMHSLALEDPQHPPLYYAIARFWAKWFGNSAAVARTYNYFLCTNDKK